MKFADDVTVLRNGKFVGGGKVSDLTPAQMADMMIGSQTTATLAARSNEKAQTPQLEIKGISADDDTGVPAISKLDMTIKSGEIVGIVGVSGNGQSELVEVLAGQRIPTAGKMVVKGKAYIGKRSQIREHRMYCLPEEPLRNACIPNMSVGGNLALRTFDRPPMTIAWTFLNPGALKRAAVDLIARYRVKTPNHSTPIRNLSGGNVQRAVLARELSSAVEVLIVQNPCFGLDFAATADIRAQIMDARNRGAAVLLVTEDLDEAFELADRIVVMFDGAFVYETPAASADIATIGRHMAGHAAGTPAGEVSVGH
jgi:simple sugar transport system ATP-binding protein